MVLEFLPILSDARQTVFWTFPTVTFQHNDKPWYGKNSLKNSTMNFSHYRAHKNLLRRINFRRCKENSPHLTNTVLQGLFNYNCTNACEFLCMLLIFVLLLNMCMHYFVAYHIFLSIWLFTSRIRTDFSLSLKF